MGKFDDIHLTWHGTRYVIPSTKVMGAIARIEDEITMAELASAIDKRRPPIGKVSRAFGALLRYAGAEVTDEDIYLGMFDGVGANVAAASAAMITLMALMLPPNATSAPAEGEVPEVEGEPPKPNPTTRPRAAAGSSKKPTRRR